MLAHRIRKAANCAGAKGQLHRAASLRVHVPGRRLLASNGLDMLDHLVAVAAAAVSIRAARARRHRSRRWSVNAQPNDEHRAIAQQLSDGTRRLILLGAIAQRDPAFADLRLVASAMAGV